MGSRKLAGAAIAIVCLGLLASACSGASGSRTGTETTTHSSAPKGTADPTDPPVAQGSESHPKTRPAVSRAPSTTVLRPVASTLPYDTSRFFELNFEGSRYLCRNAPAGFGKFDCVPYLGGRAPLITTPALYCSGSRSFPDCSTAWYPDDLDDYEHVSYQGREMLCRRAFGVGSSFGDLDCVAYNGGDPSAVSFFSNALKCTPSTLSVTCDATFYPSEMKGLTFATIDGNRYVCKDSFEGSECYRYFSGSPKTVAFGQPDYFCNSLGCDPYDYPSRF